MLTGSPVFLIGLLSSLLLTPLARMLGLRLGILDTPGQFSIHLFHTPRSGGLAVFIGFLMSMGYTSGTHLPAGLAIRTPTAYHHPHRSVPPGEDHHQPRVR